MMNRCRCGNKPELVTMTNGLVRISCVLAQCREIVCARSGMAVRAWNEINPIGADEKTTPVNPVPTYRPHVAAEPNMGDDEIPVTVEAPMSADELPTDPTGGGR
jgi:hypothetical protein